MSNETIIDFLDEVFDGLKVDVNRNDALNAATFHIEVDNGIEMILAITDEAMSANDVKAVESAIEANAKSLLENNHNATVIMAADLSCAIA
jgi:hypothetical protein